MDTTTDPHQLTELGATGYVTTGTVDALGRTLPGGAPARLLILEADIARVHLTDSHTFASIPAHRLRRYTCPAFAGDDPRGRTQCACTGEVIDQ